MIPERLEQRLHAYLGGIAKKRNVCPLAINGMRDHIHLLVKIPSDVALGQLIKELKSYSTSWMKQEGEKNFRWQRGYGAFSCSTSILGCVKRYIANQKEHHKKVTFKDELKEIAKRLGLEWKFDE